VGCLCVFRSWHIAIQRSGSCTVRPSTNVLGRRHRQHPHGGRDRTDPGRAHRTLRPVRGGRGDHRGQPRVARPGEAARAAHPARFQPDQHRRAVLRRRPAAHDRPVALGGPGRRGGPGRTRGRLRQHQHRSDRGFPGAEHGRGGGDRPAGGPAAGQSLLRVPVPLEPRHGAPQAGQPRARPGGPGPPDARVRADRRHPAGSRGTRSTRCRTSAAPGASPTRRTTS
jgi:hypothetical protein